MITIYFVENNRLAVCPSRSKGADLSSAIFVCVGSNPTAANWGARNYFLVAQSVTHLPSKQGVVSESCQGHGEFNLTLPVIAQLVERLLRSIGRVFDSPSPDLLYGRNCLTANKYKVKWSKPALERATVNARFRLILLDR